MNRLTIISIIVLLTIVMATPLFRPGNTELMDRNIGISLSADTGPFTEQISEIDGMTVVYIPAGFFLMGSGLAKDEASEADERPQNKIFVGSFWIDKTEITNTMYAHFLNEQKRTGAKASTSAEENSEFIFTDLGWAAVPGKENLPVTNVTWVEAQSYCEWAGRRLPTEAEWEKAARGEKGGIYPWGVEEPDCGRAAFQGCVDAPVNAGSLAAGQNAYGVYDMAGNVWEWVFDFYDESYYKHRDTTINPKGPDYEYYTLVLKEPLHGAVIKGGSLGDGPDSLRTANRSYYSRSEGTEFIGFRCAVSDLSAFIIQ